MKKHIEYNYWFYRIWHQFFQDERLDIALHGLGMMEDQIREDYGYSEDKSLWFRLYDDDTLVTDISSIKADFNTHNKKTLIEDLKACVKDASVQIYFS